MHRTPRFISFGASILVGLAVLAGPTWAQMQQTAPSWNPPYAPAAHRSPVEPTSMGMLEGTAKNVDPGTGTLQVSTEPLGAFRKTLEVTGDTQIQVEGRAGTLSDIQEGETVRASYETRAMHNVATQIEVIATDPRVKH